jgi:hypothetical protein
MTFEEEKAKRRDEWIKQTAYLVDQYDVSIDPEDIVDTARHLMAVAHSIAGVSCQRCHGYGYRAYGSTATWRGGIGGQAITTDVCDVCWGSGRNDVKHGDQRQLRSLLRAVDQKEKP